MAAFWGSGCPGWHWQLGQDRLLLIRQTLLQEFLEWVQQQDPHLPELQEVAKNSPIIVVEWLEEYGKHLYESNASRRNFAETINIVQQLSPT